MAKKPPDNLLEGEQDQAAGTTRPAPKRRGQRSKPLPKPRKRRQEATSPGGIHLRGNKRIAW
jgi:hypothetical protein